MLNNEWQKSSLSSAGDNCVQVRRTDSGVVQVRTSRLGSDSPVLNFTEDEWNAFTGGVAQGELTL